MTIDKFEKAKNLQLRIQKAESRINFFEESAKALLEFQTLTGEITLRGITPKGEVSKSQELTAEDFEILAKAYTSVRDLLRSEFQRL